MSNPPESNFEASRRAFDRQQRRFQELFWQEMKRYGRPLGPKLAGPKDVLAFAEDLMLCPTEDAVQVRIARDREAARGCNSCAQDVAAVADIGHVLIAAQTSPSETPFCLLGAIVRFRAEAAIQAYGDSWM